jgi:hypothetical protein
MTATNKWRLSRTLKRNVSVRPIEQDDVKYAFAAYKSGSLKDLFAEGMDPPTFKTAFESYVLSNAHAAWVITAHTKNGFIPVGLAFGGWAPQQAFMVIIGIVWFPWASKRNITEGTVGFFNSIRKELNWMGFATGEHKRIYEVCCMHAIMRRIGTTHMGDKQAAVYEGRR